MVVSEATTEATAGLSTTAAETEAITHAAITRTGEEAGAMAISLIGRVVVVVVTEVEEAGTTATMTRTTTHTAPGGGAPALAHPENAQAAGAAPATPTARLRGDLDAPGAPATPRGPGPHRHVIAAARASRAPRTARTS